MRLVRLLKLLPVLALALTAACATVPVAPPPPGNDEVAALTRALTDLGPDVDPAEAARMAEIALHYPRELAVRYGVTDPPLIHNTKVNMGLRPRGLCYQWADDIEARLRQEGFRTFDFHRAIANADNPILIDHSTVIVSRRGGSMVEGIVLDGWRDGGDLFWAPVPEDTRYTWVARHEVFAAKGWTSEAQLQQ